jgi:hypothetical protein
MCDSVDYSELIQDSVQWRVLVNTTNNLPDSIKNEELFGQLGYSHLLEKNSTPWGRWMLKKKNFVRIVIPCLKAPY